MSQRDVGYVIDRLLTDADLRIQFACDPLLTIAEFYTLGYALTSSEIDALVHGSAMLALEQDLVPEPTH
jgi:hypothetical protein